MPGMPGMPGEQPRKSNASRIVMAGVVVAVVILGIVLYVMNRKSDPATAKVGDCVKVNSVSSDNADVVKVDCTDPNALYKVTAAGSTDVTCDPNESQYTQGPKKGTATTTLCLQPNVAAGDCFRLSTDPNTPDAKVDCATTKGDSSVYKILAFDHGTSDDSKCPGGTKQSLTFTTHPGVICAKANG